MTTELPTTLEAAIAQARGATQAAIDAGCTRMQVEILLPELKPMPVAEQFLPIFADYGANLKVLFTDAGAAALARREWGEVPFVVRGIGELQAQVQPEDKLFVLVAPTAVEVPEVEKICDEVGDRPLILLNPRLEDVSVVGIGYAARQLRTRFLSLFEPCYYFRPLEQAAVLRCYPSLWQVWLEAETGYRLLAEAPEKPIGEALDQILMQTDDNSASPIAQPGFLTRLQRFIRALSQ